MFRLVRSHGKLLGNNLAFPFLLDVVYSIKECLSPHAEELHAHTPSQRVLNLSEMRRDIA